MNTSRMGARVGIVAWLSLWSVACSSDAMQNPAPDGGLQNPPPDSGMVLDIVAPPVPQRAPLTTAELNDTLTEIGARVDRARVEALSPSREDVGRKIVELLAGTPNLFDTGIGREGSVWGRLADGTPFTVALDRDPFVPGDPNPLEGPWVTTALLQVAPWKGRVLQAVGPATLYGLPTSEKAWITHVDNLAPNALSQINMMLTLQKYMPTSDNSNTAFRDSIKDVGVLWVSTHGLTYVNGRGQERYGIVTGEQMGATCNPALLDCFRTLRDVALDRGVINFSNAQHTQSYLMINADWVKTYWTLAENGLVFIDACSMYDAGAAYQEFRDAIESVFKNRTGTLLGWTKLVEKFFAERAATWFFSRVLGSDGYLPPSPKQRPFSAREVHAAMSSMGKTVDSTYRGATLMLRQFGPNETILVPSIRNMAVDEAKRELHLFGEFGHVMGTAEIETVAAAPIRWEDTEVIVTILDAGMGSKGPVVAKFRNHQESNPSPLTDWHGTSRLRHTFDGLYGGPGPYYELNCTEVHFRLDVHPFRLAPEGMARAGTTVFGNNYDPVIPINNLTQDSKCKGSAGSHGDKTMSDVTTRVTHNMAARDIDWSDQAATPANNWFFGLGRLNPITLQLFLGTSSLAHGMNAFTVQRIAPTPGQAFTMDQDFSSGAENNVILNRPQNLDAIFGVMKHIEMLMVPFGGSVDKGEWEIEIKTDVLTLPNGNTPG